MNKSLLFLMMFSSSVFAESPVRPDPTITPGVIDPQATIDKICTVGYTKTVRNVTQKMKKKVFDFYNIDPTSDKFEVDHLISLELGGSNDLKNLWPESYTTTPYNAHDKDVLENKLHDLVCADKLPLVQAQIEIASDWVRAYKEYVEQH